jgi:hypothetical protein
MSDTLRLNLGACDRRVPGFISVDICEPADQIVDLSKDWPWTDSSVDEVLAYSVFEHLPDKRHTMNELWRVMKPGALARLQLPHATKGDGGHCDPTHCSYWTASDFEYYTPGVAERERFRGSYGVNADFLVKNLDPSGHIPMREYRRLYGGTVVEFDVVLEAVK